MLIRWSSLYPDAGAILDQDFEPLPRHIIEGPLETFEKDVSTGKPSSPTGTSDDRYVGAGPFRLTHWEPGSYIEGEAFAGHALGRPKIDHIQLRIIGDENTVLSNLLAQNVHFAARLTLRFEHGLVLRQNWGAGSDKGTIFLESSAHRAGGDPVSSRVSEDARPDGRSGAEGARLHNR